MDICQYILLTTVFRFKLIFFSHSMSKQNSSSGNLSSEMEYSSNLESEFTPPLIPSSEEMEESEEKSSTSTSETLQNPKKRGRSGSNTSDESGSDKDRRKSGRVIISAKKIPEIYVSYRLKDGTINFFKNSNQRPETDVAGQSEGDHVTAYTEILQATLSSVNSMGIDSASDSMMEFGKSVLQGDRSDRFVEIQKPILYEDGWRQDRAEIAIKSTLVDSIIRSPSNPNFLSQDFELIDEILNHVRSTGTKEMLDKLYGLMTSGTNQQDFFEPLTAKYPNLESFKERLSSSKPDLIKIQPDIELNSKNQILS